MILVLCDYTNDFIKNNWNSDQGWYLIVYRSLFNELLETGKTKNKKKK